MYFKKKKARLSRSYLKYIQRRGAWLAQSVKDLTLDFGSGRDLTLRGIEPRLGLCADSSEPAWDFLSPSLYAPLSFKINK